MSAPPPQNNSISNYFENAGKAAGSLVKKAGNYSGNLVALLQGKKSSAGKEPLPMVNSNGIEIEFPDARLATEDDLVPDLRKMLMNNQKRNRPEAEAEASRQTRLRKDTADVVELEGDTRGGRGARDAGPSASSGFKPTPIVFDIIESRNASKPADGNRVCSFPAKSSQQARPGSTWGSTNSQEDLPRRSVHARLGDQSPSGSQSPNSGVHVGRANQMSPGLHGCEGDRTLRTYNTKLFRTAVNGISTTPGLSNYERHSSQRRLAGNEQRGGDRRAGRSKADHQIDLT